MGTEYESKSKIRLQNSWTKKTSGPPLGHFLKLTLGDISDRGATEKQRKQLGTFSVPADEI